MDSKKGLSKNVMAMRFMRRKEEAEERERLENELKKKIQDSHWVAKQDARGLSLEEGSSFQFSRKCGRMSFGKFNPLIEKLNKDLQAEKIDKSETPKVNIVEEQRQEGTIPEDEMVERYQEVMEGKTPYGRKRMGDPPRKKKKKMQKLDV